MAATLKQQALNYLGNGIPGDLWNGVCGAQLNLGTPEDWREIKPVPTFAAYIRDVKFGHNRELAEKVIELSDRDKVAQHDALIDEINSAIGDGVTSAEQAARIRDKLDKLSDFIYR